MCTGQNKGDCTSYIKSISGRIIDKEVQQTLFSKNKEVIPCLINHIDEVKTVCLRTFVNPMSSHFLKFVCGNQIGIRYAYLIEFFLAKDSIETNDKKSNDEPVLWKDVIKPYQIYNYGVIVKKGFDNEPVLKPLLYEDMIKIKKMYSDWWNLNKGKSIKSLRKEYRTNKSILKDPYMWI